MLKKRVKNNIPKKKEKRTALFQRSLVGFAAWLHKLAKENGVLEGHVLTGVPLRRQFHVFFPRKRLVSA